MTFSGLSDYIWVAIGGAIGSVARLACAEWLAASAFPWATLMVNVAGSLAIGVFAGATGPDGRFPAPEAMRLFLMAGLCGGFTTFSAFSLQTFALIRAGALGAAALNVGASVLLCLLAVWAGAAAAAWLSAR